MAHTYKINGVEYSYELIAEFLTKINYEKKYIGETRDDAINKLLKDDSDITYIKNNNGMRLGLGKWFSVQMTINDSKKTVSQWVALDIISHEGQSYTFGAVGVLGYMPVRDAVMVSIASLGLTADPEDAHDLYNTLKARESVKKDMKKAMIDNDVIALYKDGKTFIDVYFMYALQRGLWDIGMYEEDTYRTTPPAIDQRITLNIQNQYPSVPQLCFDKVLSIIDAYDLYNFIENSYLVVLSNRDFSNVSLSVFNDLNNKEVTFSIYNNRINSNLPISLERGEETTIWQIAVNSVAQIYYNAWGLRGDTFYKKYDENKYIDGGWILGNKLRLYEIIDDFTDDPDVDTYQIYVWDNFAVGTRLHAMTGVFIDPDAVKPTTQEESRNLATTYPDWWANKIGLLQNDVRYLPNEYTDISNLNTPPQAQAQDGNATPVLFTTMIDPFVATIGSEEPGGGSGGGPGGGNTPDPFPPINPPQPDKTETPDVILPTTNVLGSGVVTAYEMTSSQLKNVSDWLWAGSLVEAIPKLLDNPMDAIIGLKAMFCPTRSVATKFIVGGVNSNIDCNVLTHQYEELDCGTITVSEWFHNVLDYSPYTTLQLYLPFVGFVQLDTDTFMSANTKMNIKYYFDTLTGVCVANVYVNNDTINGLYASYEGNCGYDMPIVGGRVLSGITKIGLGLVGAIAGGAIAGGTAAVAGATGIQRAVNSGKTGLSQANDVISAMDSAEYATNSATARGATAGLIGAYGASKNQIIQNGTLSGNAGVFGVKKPFLLISRPTQADASLFNQFYGRTTNRTRVLGSMSGFVKVKSVHVEGINATPYEKTQIEELLMQGVKL